MSNNYCVCSHCGFTEPVTEGIPCSMKACIECSGLMSEKTSEEISTSSGTSGDISSVHGGQAVIDYEICTSCGACIDGCLYSSIVMKDDKPVVDPGGCAGCLACGLSCPVDAIS